MVVTKLESKKRPVSLKRISITLVAIILFALLVCSGLAVYVGWSLTHTARKPINDTPERLGMKFESIEFPSRSNDIGLKGWYLPAAPDNNRNLTVIFAHGYSKNRLQDDVPALDVAKGLVDAGYSVVMFDFRNSGESQGKITSVGQFEEQDLLGAFDWTKANHPGKIGLIGFSMGATTALLAAADEKEIAGVVADSPFGHLRHYLEDNLPVWSHLPAFPFTPLILSILPPLTGLEPDQVDALSAVDRIYPRPVLFIHSTDDSKIPYTNSEAMWQKHPDRFEFWKTSGADHVGSFKKQREAYLEHVLAALRSW